MQNRFFAGLLIVLASFFMSIVARAVILPPTKSVTLTWEYSQMDSNIVFKVYQSTNLAIPLEQWTEVTNVTGLSCVLPMKSDTCFYTVAASNTVTGMQSAFR